MLGGAGRGRHRGSTGSLSFCGQGTWNICIKWTLQKCPSHVATISDLLVAMQNASVSLPNGHGATSSGAAYNAAHGPCQPLHLRRLMLKSSIISGTSIHTEGAHTCRHRQQRRHRRLRCRLTPFGKFSRNFRDHLPLAHQGGPTSS